MNDNKTYLRAGIRLDVTSGECSGGGTREFEIKLLVYPGFREINANNMVCCTGKYIRLYMVN